MPKYGLREQTNDDAFVQNVVKDMQEHFEEYMIPDDPEKQEAFLKKFETEYAGLCSYDYSFSDNLKAMIKDYNQAVRSPEGFTQDVMKKMYGNLSKLNYQVALEFQNRDWGTDNQFPPAERSPEHFKKYANRIWAFVTGHMRRQDESIGVFTPIAYKEGFFDKFDFDAAYQPYMNVKAEEEQKENGEAEAAKKEAEEAEAAKKKAEEEEAAKKKAEEAEAAKKKAEEEEEARKKAAEKEEEDQKKADAEKAEKERIAQERWEKINAVQTPKEYTEQLDKMTKNITLRDIDGRYNLLYRQPYFIGFFPRLLKYYFRVLQNGSFVDDKDRDYCFDNLGKYVIRHFGLDDGKSAKEMFPVNERTPELFTEKMSELWDFIKVLYAEVSAHTKNYGYVAQLGLFEPEEVKALYQTFMEKRKLAAEEAAKEPEKAPEEPKAEAPAEELKAEAPVEEPKEPEKAPEEPKAEVPAEEPKAEAPAEEPKAEVPAEEPKVLQKKQLATYDEGLMESGFGYNLSRVLKIAGTEMLNMPSGNYLLNSIFSGWKTIEETGNFKNRVSLSNNFDQLTRAFIFLRMNDGKDKKELFPENVRTPELFRDKCRELLTYLYTELLQKDLGTHRAFSAKYLDEAYRKFRQSYDIPEHQPNAERVAEVQKELADKEAKGEAERKLKSAKYWAEVKEKIEEPRKKGVQAEAPKEPEKAAEEPKAEAPVEEPKAEVPVEAPKEPEKAPEIPVPQPAVEVQPAQEAPVQPEAEPQPEPQVEAPVQAPQDVLQDALEAFQVASNAGIWGRGGHPTEFGNVRTTAAAYKQADAQNRNRAAQELYRACRVYMDRHTDNGAAQYDIGGQLSIGGRLRKQAIVQILQIMTENPDNPAFANLDADYRNACQAENREPMALNIATMEGSLATHSKAKMPRGVQHSARDKAYAELKTATTVFRERVQREEEAERQRRQRDQEKREREAQRQREREARRNQPKPKK